MAFLRVKCDLEGDVRRFCLDEPLVFVELKKHLETIYDMGELVIRYKDDEDDLVTVAAEADLLEARNLFDKDALFRFKLFKKEPLKAEKKEKKEKQEKKVKKEKQEKQEKQEKKEKLCDETSTPKDETGNQLQLIRLLSQFKDANKAQWKEVKQVSKEALKQVSKEALKTWKASSQASAQASSQAPAQAPAQAEKLGNPVKAMARFVSHVTLPEGEKLPAGAPVTKVWRVRNDSPRPWPPGPIELVYVSGKAADRLSAEHAYPVEIHSLPPGQETDLSVEITTPTKPGLYQAFWRLRGPKGNKFGQRLSCSVLVKDNDDVVVSESDTSFDTDSDGVVSEIENEDDSDGFVDVGDKFEKSEPSGKKCKWVEQLAVLKEAGFDDAKLGMKMLKKCKGDVAKAAKKLAKKNLKKATKAAKKLEDMAIKQAKYSPGAKTDKVADKVAAADVAPVEMADKVVPAQVETTTEAKPPVWAPVEVIESYEDIVNQHRLTVLRQAAIDELSKGLAQV